LEEDKMISLLYDPVEAVDEAKKMRNFGTSFLVLVVASLFMALAMIIGTRGLAWLPAIILFIVIIVLSLFAGLLTQLAFTTLTGKGGYFEGFTVVVYPMLAPAAALLIGSILILIPYIGMILSALLMAIAMILGYATFFRAAKELFHTDYVVALIGFIVIWTATFFAAYGTVIFAMMGSAFGQFMPMMALLG
jgi:hypothetical protein